VSVNKVLIIIIVITVIMVVIIIMKAMMTTVMEMAIAMEIVIVIHNVNNFGIIVAHLMVNVVPIIVIITTVNGHLGCVSPKYVDLKLIVN
jgi:hypothetical protein